MRRLVSSVFGFAAVAISLWQVAESPKPLLVWNVTDSAPIGLYRRSTASVVRHSLALVRTPEGVANLAAERHYLPRNVPMVKRIAALSGDTVCRFGGAIRINGEFAANALTHDHLGRALPQWSGCRRLKEDDVFLLNAPPMSFDSRYFGPVSASNLIERIEPLWTF